MSETLTLDAAPAQAAPDYRAIKAKQNVAWSSGDYAVIGTTLQIVGETLAEALDLRGHEKVLDVAAGNGNFTLAAARRWTEVTALDYVPELLARARERAAADRLPITCREGDAEALPFADGTFDVVGSTFGVMFTPHQEQAAAEMLRVCRSGGRIGLANWTPDGFIGALFGTIGRHVPPPPGVKSPALWGKPSRLEELFGPDAAGIAIIDRSFVFRYRSPEHWLDVFRTLYGPVMKAFEAVGATGQAALASDLTDLVARFNTVRDGTMVVPGAYLEVVVTKR